MDSEGLWKLSNFLPNFAKNLKFLPKIKSTFKTHLLSPTILQQLLSPSFPLVVVPMTGFQSSAKVKSDTSCRLSWRTPWRPGVLHFFTTLGEL